MNRKEPVMYVTMGVSATIFNWLVYAMLVLYMPMALANALSWTATLLFAFVTNKCYVFGSRTWERRVVFREFIAFLTARGLTGILEIVLQPQLYAWGLDQALFGIEGMEAKITVCLSMALLNYFSTKWIVFREPIQRNI